MFNSKRDSSSPSRWRKAGFFDMIPTVFEWQF